MRGDLPAAAVRLRECLPVRTHELRVVDHIQGRKYAPAILINHRKFDNVMDAVRKLKLSRQRVRRMLEKGEAIYA